MKKFIENKYSLDDGGGLSFKHFEASDRIEVQVRGSDGHVALVMSRAEAVMLAKALLDCACPSESDFWDDDETPAYDDEPSADATVFSLTGYRIAPDGSGAA